MSYEAERAIAKAAKHGFAYRGFGYAEHIATFNPEFCLGLLDKLERYERLSKWMQCDWDCNDRLSSGGCDCGFQAALNQTEAQNA